MDYFLCVMGMVLVVEGLPYLTFPDKLKTYLRKLTAIPDMTLRIMGFIAVCIGLLLVYIGRN
jgi:uncharacterized protein YjeT (DUF2065 family)